MKNYHGFSLIELVVTLAIVAVLACLSYPSYMHHLIAVRRANVAVALTDLAGRMEQYYIQNNTYAGATLDGLGEDESSYKNYYQITMTTQSNTYTLIATPLNTQAQADVLCGIMTIDQDNRKTVTGSGPVTECW